MYWNKKPRRKSSCKKAGLFPFEGGIAIMPQDQRPKPFLGKAPQTRLFYLACGIAFTLGLLEARLMLLPAQALKLPSLQAPAVFKGKSGREANKVPKAETSKASEQKPPSAIESYNQGVRLFQAAQLEGQKGEVSNQKSLFKQSEQAFKSALKQDSKLVEAQSNLGYLALARKDLDKAVEQFQKALGVNNKHLSSLNGLATAYALQGQSDKALTCLDTLNQLAPAEFQYWYNRGCVLQQAKRLSEAEQAYQKALKLQPTHQSTLFNLATLYHNQNQQEQALLYYKKAQDAAPDNPVGLEAYHRLQGLK
jgi:tetratricopeptide (TPR) repeat protein